MGPKNDKKKRRNKNRQQNVQNNQGATVTINGSQVESQFQVTTKQSVSSNENEIARSKNGVDNIKNTKKSIVIENVKKSESCLDENKTGAQHRLNIVKKVSNLLDVKNKSFITVLEKLLELYEDKSTEKALRLQLIVLLFNHLEASDTDEVRLLLKVCQNSLLRQEFVKYIVDGKALDSRGILLGQGGFGTVTLGKLCKSGGPSINVAVKTSIMTKYNKLLEEEAKIMSRFDHKNVVKMLAFQKNPPKIAMEYMDWGNLTAALKRNFTDRELVNALHDVASGMEYIADMDYVHRDLACKNIFVNSKKQCKVGDFGLCKYVGDSNGYYEEKKDFLVMFNTAPESKLSQIFSTKSDVWSMGILIWEVYYAVENQFLDVRIKQVREMMHLDMFQITGRLSKPPRCPASLYLYILNELFHADPRKRPSFTAIKKVIISQLR